MKKILIPLLLLVIALPVAAQISVDAITVLDTVIKSPLEQFNDVIRWVISFLTLFGIVAFFVGVIGFFVTQHKYRKVSQVNPAEILPHFKKTKEEWISQLLRFAGLLIIFYTAISVSNKLDGCGGTTSISLYQVLLYSGIAIFLVGVMLRILAAKKASSTISMGTLQSDAFDSEESQKRYLQIHILHRLYARVILSSIALFVVSLLVWSITTFTLARGCGVYTM